MATTAARRGSGGGASLHLAVVHNDARSCMNFNLSPVRLRCRALLTEGSAERLELVKV
jgi:hypothetical protein